MKTHEAFVGLIVDSWQMHRVELERRAEAARQKRDDPDWFWDVLVTSFCTLGGSANLEVKQAKYGSRVAWSSVLAVSPDERASLFRDLPNPRWRKQVTAALHAAFDRIRSAGGPAEVASQYLALPTAVERIRFLQSFKGIGAKYSRNIPMDVYDETVLDFAALDSRLNNLLDLVADAPRRGSYRLREDYLRQVRVSAGLPNMWFLDRLLYRQYSAMVEQLKS
jgi:hypothetical protein